MEIKFEHVRYGFENSVPIFKDLTLEMPKKKITAIIGKSGSGKTLITELLLARKIPVAGKITVGPFEIKPGIERWTDPNLYRLVGIVGQYPEDFFVAPTVREEIEFAMKNYQYKKENLDAHVLAALKMVQLNPSYLNKNPFQLSLGEKKKVAFASMIAYNPSVIILDEPTTGLDSASIQHWLRMLRNLKRKYQKTIIVLSRDTDFIIQLADQVLILDQNKIICKGRKMEVLKQVDQLTQAGIKIPKTILFSKKVLEQKKIKLGYRDDINDLIKDVYRYAK